MNSCPLACRVKREAMKQADPNSRDSGGGEEEEREEHVTEQILGGAIEVHKHWGPGLYEEIYQRSLCHELRLRKVPFESQVKLPLLFLPLQIVCANLRLAIPAVDLRAIEARIANLGFARTSSPWLSASVVSFPTARTIFECRLGTGCRKR